MWRGWRRGRRGQSKTAGEGKGRQFFSFLCQLHIHGCWGLGMQSALCTLRLTQFSKKRHKQKRTKWNKSHTRRTYTRRCGNSERTTEALGSQGCFREKQEQAKTGRLHGSTSTGKTAQWAWGGAHFLGSARKETAGRGTYLEGRWDREQGDAHRVGTSQFLNRSRAVAS